MAIRPPTNMAAPISKAQNQAICVAPARRCDGTLSLPVVGVAGLGGVDKTRLRSCWCSTASLIRFGNPGPENASPISKQDTTGSSRNSTSNSCSKSAPNIHACAPAYNFSPRSSHVTSTRCGSRRRRGQMWGHRLSPSSIGPIPWSPSWWKRRRLTLPSCLKMQRFQFWKKERKKVKFKSQMSLSLSAKWRYQQTYKKYQFWMSSSRTRLNCSSQKESRSSLQLLIFQLMMSLAAFSNCIVPMSSTWLTS